MKLLDGRKGLIFGIANDRSIAQFLTEDYSGHGQGIARDNSSVSGFHHRLVS